MNGIVSRIQLGRWKGVNLGFRSRHNKPYVTSKSLFVSETKSAAHLNKAEVRLPFQCSQALNTLVHLAVVV